jgi:hypothetical protein
MNSTLQISQIQVPAGENLNDATPNQFIERPL